MSRRAKVLLALGACAALAASGWLLVRRQQDLARARAFAAQAARMRTNTAAAVEFYKHIGLRGSSPTEEEFRAWQDRNVRIDAEARRAALALRSAAARELALEWLATQQALRSASVAARVIVASRILFDYCSERQQFIARALRDFAASARATAMAECFDQGRPGGDSALNTLRAEADRLRAEEAALWARLLAVAPELGR